MVLNVNPLGGGWAELPSPGVVSADESVVDFSVFIAALVPAPTPPPSPAPAAPVLPPVDVSFVDAYDVPAPSVDVPLTSDAWPMTFTSAPEQATVAGDAAVLIAPHTYAEPDAVEHIQPRPGQPPAPQQPQPQPPLASSASIVVSAPEAPQTSDVAAPVPHVSVAPAPQQPTSAKTPIADTLELTHTTTPAEADAPALPRDVVDVMSEAIDATPERTVAVAARNAPPVMHETPVARARDIVPPVFRDNTSVRRDDQPVTPQPTAPAQASAQSLPEVHTMAAQAAPATPAAAQMLAHVPVTSESPTPAPVQPPPAPASLASPTAEDGTPVLARIVETLRMQVKDGGGQAEIRLRPEVLGAVTVSLVVARGVVRATLSAESPAALEYLRAEASSLQKSLEERGLTLEEFEVRDSAEWLASRDHQREREDEADDAEPRAVTSSRKGGPDFADVIAAFDVVA